MANFSDLRTIPRRIDIVGSRDKGIDYIGIANSQLKILENEMEISNKDKKEYAKINIGSRTVKLDDGNIVEAWTNMNMSGVKITTPKGMPTPEKEKRKCFCTCHVAIGYIQTIRHGCYDFIGHDVENIVRRSVVICKKKTQYTLLINVLPMTWTPYYDGQRVLVVFMPLDDKHYVPGIDQGCLMIKARITNIKENHQKWYDDEESEV